MRLVAERSIELGDRHVRVQAPTRAGDEPVLKTRTDAEEAAAWPPDVPVPADMGRCIDATASPDGSRVAFASDRDGLFQVFTMAADGSDVRKVAEAYGTSPTWSPDGTALAYSGSTVAQSARSPLPTSVCLVDAAAGEPEMIPGASMGSYPSWGIGPEGQESIYFIRNGWLMRYDVDSGEVAQIA